MAGKTELIETVAQRTGLSKSDVGKVIEETFAEIRRTVDGGETVALRGFGTFRISERAARKGRNPQTGEPIDIAASRSLAFKASK
ncbi:MAG: HU family DNA-binding protein [Chloroflexota bacterium]|nr:HU family DNA-binding protein [Chloroflexota bacterium]